MRVLITGATGTIGLALADALSARGDQVVALSRDPERGQRVLGEHVEVHPWPDPEGARPPTEASPGAAERCQRGLGEQVEVHPCPDREGARPPPEALAGADAVVNLLGEPVA